MFVIKKKWFFFILSAVLVIASIVIITTSKLNTSIEFTGGSALEVSYDTRPDIELIKSAYAQLDLGGKVQPFNDNGVVVRTKDLTESERQTLVEALAINGQVPAIDQFTSIGPSVGKEMRRKALIAIILVAIGIVLFVAYAFRGISKSDDEGKKRFGPSAWSYGGIAVIALIHDILIPTGIFVLLGREVNTLFVVGLLSILGLSVNDTIVVFDRIRENLRDNAAKPKGKKSFAQIVGKSLYETIGRSVFTSITLIVVLVALAVVGPAATQDLALIMAIGTLVGTYSSIFLASPLLVAFFEKREAKRAKIKSRK